MTLKWSNDKSNKALNSFLYHKMGRMEEKTKMSSKNHNAYFVLTNCWWEPVMQFDYNMVRSRHKSQPFVAVVSVFIDILSSLRKKPVIRMQLLYDDKDFNWTVHYHFSSGFIRCSVRAFTLMQMHLSHFHIYLLKMWMCFSLEANKTHTKVTIVKRFLGTFLGFIFISKCIFLVIWPTTCTIYHSLNTSQIIQMLRFFRLSDVDK